MSRIAELRQKRDNYLATANRIVSAAVTEQRSLSEKEQADVDGLKGKAAAINETIRQHDSLRDLVEDDERPTEWQQRSARPEASEDDGLSVARMVRSLAAGKGDPERAAAHCERVYGDGEVAKALAAGVGSAGGFLVPERYSLELIEFLRPASVVRAMGARTVPLPQGNMTISKVIEGTSANYISENLDIPVTAAKFGAVKLTSKKLAGIVPISNDLIRFSSPSADEFVRDDLVKAVAQAEDGYFLRSDGTGAGPKGLRYWAPAANRLNVNATVNLTNVDVDLNKLILQLLNANVGMVRPGWIMSPRTYIYLLGLRDPNGNKAFPELEQRRLKGYPVALTTQIPINLAVTNTNESEIYFADFADVVVGEVPGILIDASGEAAYHDGSGVVSAFSRDQTVVRIIMQNDLVLRHAESVAVLIDVDWS